MRHRFGAEKALIGRRIEMEYWRVAVDFNCAIWLLDNSLAVPIGITVIYGPAGQEIRLVREGNP